MSICITPSAPKSTPGSSSILTPPPSSCGSNIPAAAASPSAPPPDETAAGGSASIDDDNGCEDEDGACAAPAAPAEPADREARRCTCACAACALACCCCCCCCCCCACLACSHSNRCIVCCTGGAPLGSNNESDSNDRSASDSRTRLEAAAPTSPLPASAAGGADVAVFRSRGNVVGRGAMVPHAPGSHNDDVSCCWSDWRKRAAFCPRGEGSTRSSALRISRRILAAAASSFSI